MRGSVGRRRIISTLEKRGPRQQKRSSRARQEVVGIDAGVRQTLNIYIGSPIDMAHDYQCFGFRPELFLFAGPTLADLEGGPIYRGQQIYI
jgi:hypothetical protein